MSNDGVMYPEFELSSPKPKNSVKGDLIIHVFQNVAYTNLVHSEPMHTQSYKMQLLIGLSWMFWFWFFDFHFEISTNLTGPFILL